METLCTKLVKTKRFGKVPCLYAEGHSGRHSPNLTGQDKDKRIGERGPNYVTPRGREFISFWTTPILGPRRLVSSSDLLKGYSFSTCNASIAGISKTKEYQTAHDHYRWAHNQKNPGKYRIYKDVHFFSEWDSAKNTREAKRIFANKAFLWMRGNMPKPTAGKWQLHVGRDSNGIKRFEPGYLSWEPMDDIHVRNKKRELKEYELDDLRTHVQLRELTEF